MNNDQEIKLQQEIPPELNRQRLDAALAKLFPQYSRSQLQHWIKNGNVRLNQEICLIPRQKVIAEDQVAIAATLESEERWQPQNISLDIIYEDDNLLIINKPPKLVVHPGAGNPHSTLVNALLHHDTGLTNVPRAGIIHRLDKDTSGLLVVAKNLTTHTALVRAMKEREIKREYLAIIKGCIVGGKTIDAPMGRHPTHRVKMAVVPTGRPAITHFTVKERFPAHTLVHVQLETGRTHQIRVHMTHIHHPIAGDPLYGTHIATPAKASDSLKQALKQLKRQALHAFKLSLEHPTTKQWMEFEAPIPDDFNQLLIALREQPIDED